MSTIMHNHLNSIMQFDHVIRVNEGGSIDEISKVYAPEVSVMLDADGQITDVAESEMIMWVASQGWTLLTGWSGQWRYSGPIMHGSEFVGGGLAEHIMGTPGYYCAVAVECDQEGWDNPNESPGPAGWAVAFRETV